jgi:RNA-splicing ligase RtcB
VKRDFAGTEIEGIVTNTKHVVLDECRHVYKDLDAVLDTLSLAGIARVSRRMFPVANIKGVD